MMERSSIGYTDATVIDLADDLAECPMWGGDGWDLAFGRLACGFLNAGLFGGLGAALGWIYCRRLQLTQLEREGSQDCSLRHVELIVHLLSEVF